MMRRSKISIDNPLEIRLEIGVRDNMFLYPLDEIFDETSNEFREALKIGIRESDDEFEDSGTYELSILHKDTQIVQSRGFYINEWSEEYNMYDGLSDMADAYDEAAMRAFRALEDWDEFVPVVEDDYEEHPCCVYIERLYINPEYRENGFATYVLAHMGEIFKHKYGYDLRYACAYVNPDDQDFMPREEMLRIMIKTLEKTGFVRIPCEEDEIIYAKRFLE